LFYSSKSTTVFENSVMAARDGIRSAGGNEDLQIMGNRLEARRAGVAQGSTWPDRTPLEPTLRALIQANTITGTGTSAGTGKTTNTAFNSPEGCPLNITEPGWSIADSCADTYRISAPHDYLTHDDLPVDEPVWLRPDDVAQGKDTVVDAALRRINSHKP